MSEKVIAKYSGKEMLYRYDHETGEMVEVGMSDVVVKRIDSRNGGFMITYLAEIISLIETLGNKKMQIVKYILKNMDKTSNLLIATTRKIAEETETSTKTVTETLKALEQADIIKRQSGVILLNPKLMNNRSANGEKILLTKYIEFDNE